MAGDLSKLEIQVLRVLARLEKACTAEIASLARVSLPSARQALRVLEERSLLEEVLANVLTPNVGGVQVVIGGEGGWEELKDCSMVLTRYGAPGFATGALGVLGPTRMAYGRTISAVRYVAGLLSDLVIESFAG